jgi:uncharacterized protein with PIN domain
MMAPHDPPHEPEQREATFRFYAELNELLPDELRQVPFPVAFRGAPAVKDTIESLGVPHTEIDLILVNGTSVGFDHPLADGDAVSVFPVFEGLDITPVVRLRPEPLRETRFVADVHLGKLARALRLLGFDTAWDTALDDARIIDVALAQGRIILTRDRTMLKSKRVTHGYLVRNTDPAEQVLEVIDRLDLRGSVAPFTRCTVCNGEIVAETLEAGRAEAPERVREWCDEYFRCRGCGKLYWRGTHFTRLEDFVSSVVSGRTPRP